jgi:hypothetical protein
MYEDEILHWRFGAESKDAKLAWLVGKQIPDYMRVNTPGVLWFKLQAALEELPLALQAFILRDEQGNEVEVNGRKGPLGVHPDIQSWRNLAVIGRSETELKEIVGSASKRIEKSIQDQLSGQRSPRIPDFEHPEVLLQRARHRLILVLGVQELISYLINPKQRDGIFFASTYYESDAARSHFYVGDDGRIKFTPPRLVQLLEGVEAARIRECPICFKFFWAGRKDMIGCSTRCSNAYRMRKYRKQFYVKAEKR